MLFVQRLLVFSDSKTATAYAFTQADYPAHPAWIARTRVNDGKRTRVIQTGYYAGDRRAFAAFFKAEEQALQERMQDAISDREKAPHSSGEAPVHPERRAE